MLRSGFVLVALGVTSGLAFGPAASLAQSGCGCPPIASRPVIEVSDNQGMGTGTTTWSCDQTYLLTETVFVNSGDSLTIEPGTVVKGRAGVVTDTLTYTLPNGLPSKRVDYVYSEVAGSLVVARGGYIHAEGTEACPIIFTHENDALNGTSNLQDRGLWGGLIVCGGGEINTYDGNDLAEGVEDPTGMNRHLYGENLDPEGSCGVLRYLSLRHGSVSLGISQFGNGNETNLLQLCAIGSNTQVDHIETIASADDGVQIFGGTADIRHLITLFNSEDQWEFDQGWRGRGQFILALNNATQGMGDHAADFEGDDYEEFDVTLTFMPYTSPQLYNMTFLGDNDTTAIRLHNGGGVRMHNSLFAQFDLGIDFEDDDPCDAWELYLFGETTIENNRFYNIGDSTGWGEIIDYNAMVWNGVEFVPGGVFNGQEVMEGVIMDNNNFAADPLMDVTFATDGMLITDTIWPFPNSMDMLVSDDAYYPPNDGWFDQAMYIGAFDPSGANWAAGWTLADEMGLFGDDGSGSGETNLLGCTYWFACNYNPEAVVDDGSCEITSCAGCTLTCSPSYDPTAVFDDGSCIPCELGMDCMGDLDGDGIVTVQDMLLLLSVFGTTCPN